MALLLSCEKGHGYVQPDICVGEWKGCPQCSAERREKVIWAAGFFDGEGSVSITKRPRPKRTYLTLCIRASQVTREPLEVFTELWGGTICTASRPSTEKNSRMIYQWNVSARTAGLALAELAPYLRVKKVQAELGLVFHARRAGRGCKPRLVDEEQDWKDRAEMQRLNARGLKAA